MGILQTAAWQRDIIGISPRRGSHAAALIAFSHDWTEVSLSPRADRRAFAAAQISGTALYRSVLNQDSSGELLCSSGFDSATSWRSVPAAFNHKGCAGESI